MHINIDPSISYVKISISLNPFLFRLQIIYYPPCCKTILYAVLLPALLCIFNIKVHMPFCDQETNLAKSLWSIPQSLLSSSANFRTLLLISSSKSFMNLENSRSPNTEPCETPLQAVIQLDPLLLMHTLCLLFYNKLPITANKLPPIPCFLKLFQ